MSFCPKCGFDTDESDAFCRACGATQSPHGPSAIVVAAPPTAATTPAAGRPAGRPRRRGAIIVAMALAQIALVGGIIFAVSGKGCSSTEGSFAADGGPLGTFTFTPTQCRSGERMSFFGVILVGDGPTAGGVLVVDDPVKGRLLKVEIPGSCKPPDYEVCTVVELGPDVCPTLDMKIEKTNSTVNDIRLIDGRVRADCTFPEGGTFRGNVTFESCD